MLFEVVIACLELWFDLFFLEGDNFLPMVVYWVWVGFVFLDAVDEPLEILGVGRWGVRGVVVAVFG